MKIIIVTPESPSSTLGNAVTANRWAEILRKLGHEVTLATQWVSDEQHPCDLLIALHARRSYPSMERFRRAHANRPLILALTGTDLYNDIPSGDREAHQSLELVTRIVALQQAAGEGLPEHIQRKISIVYQSAVRPQNPRPLREDCFEICVLSHLREVKDPLAAALAARRLPSSSRVRVMHAGRALAAEWEARAREEERINSRYVWLGDQPHQQAIQLLSGSRLLVLSSLMEGGASAIAEAVVCGVPVLCSRIPGNLGMLGRSYDGYFPVGDYAALADLLQRMEGDGILRERLRNHVVALQPRFAPAAERLAWKRLLALL